MKAENRKRNVSLENVRNEWKVKGRKRRWNKIAGENMNRDKSKQVGGFGDVRVFWTEKNALAQGR